MSVLVPPGRVEARWVPGWARDFSVSWVGEGAGKSRNRRKVGRGIWGFWSANAGIKGVLREPSIRWLRANSNRPALQRSGSGQESVTDHATAAASTGVKIEQS